MSQSNIGSIRDLEKGISAGPLPTPEVERRLRHMWAQVGRVATCPFRRCLLAGFAGYRLGRAVRGSDRCIFRKSRKAGKCLRCPRDLFFARAYAVSARLISVLLKQNGIDFLCWINHILSAQ